MLRRAALVSGLICAALPARAHPHVFVDTEMRVFVEDGQAVAVELTWVYDEFFSLLIFEDMGLDPDGDGALTSEELATLKGFDFEVWPDGFEGDLYAYANGQKITLDYPEITGVAVENGKIVSRHIRRMAAVPAAQLEVLQYDPTYYVAYSLQRPVIVEGGCTAQVTPHDPDAAAEAVEVEMSRIPEDMFEQVMLGIHYADRIGFECASSS